MSFAALLILYIAFRIKHTLCDHFLQTTRMATQKHKDLLALLSHAGIHAIGTLIISLILAPSFWWLALIDLIIHAAIDYIKANIVVRKNLTPEMKPYWWAMGLDQEAHNFTHLAFIVLIFMQTNGMYIFS